MGIAAIILSDFNRLCAQADSDQNVTAPTFQLAMTLLADSHWSAVKPHAPLRYWQLLTLEHPKRLVQSAFFIDETILHYCLGEPYQDPLLEPYLKPVVLPESPIPLSGTHAALADELTALWTASATTTQPITQLLGSQTQTALNIASAACAQLQAPLYQTSVGRLALTPNELAQLQRRWQRAHHLTRSILVIDCDDLNPDDPTQRTTLNKLLEDWTVPLLLLGDAPIQTKQRPLQRLELPPRSTAEQVQQWQTLLAEERSLDPNCIDTLANQFQLDTLQLQTAAQQARHRHAQQQKSASLESQLWESCRRQVRPRLDDLAKRIEPRESLQDLILPKAPHQLLQELIAMVQYQLQVYEDWGLGKKNERGLGVTALFVGASGTGKTMAASVIAQTLNLDLYRIDLSATVNKYIGETEKNLKRIFDAAESGGVVLLFDEADAIFGKRSPVNDSRDRYANMEVSYLLQRLEAYRGLAILTTNLKEAIDPAFLRRIRFVVRFPFPDEVQRRQMWQQIYPQTVPTADLNFRKLAKLNVAGGNIRNIAFSAAFKAAKAGTSVTMAHLLGAAESEFYKLEQPLPSREVEDWLTRDAPQQAITQAMFSLDGVDWEDAMITEAELAEWRRKEQAEIAELKRQELEGDF